MWKEENIKTRRFRLLIWILSKLDRAGLLKTKTNEDVNAPTSRGWLEVCDRGTYTESEILCPYRVGYMRDRWIDRRVGIPTVND